MKAVHIRTREPCPFDPLGFEYSILDSLFIPEASILLGYVRYGKKSGAVFSYLFSECGNRAQAIVDGKPVDDKLVKGRVIGTIELDGETVEKIRKNYNPDYGDFYRHVEDVEIVAPFKNSSTEQLVKILDGSYMADSK